MYIGVYREHSDVTFDWLDKNGWLVGDDGDWYAAIDVDYACRFSYKFDGRLFFYGVTTDKGRIWVPIGPTTTDLFKEWAKRHGIFITNYAAAVKKILRSTWTEGPITNGDMVIYVYEELTMKVSVDVLGNVTTRGVYRGKERIFDIYLTDADSLCKWLEAFLPF